MSKYLSKCYYCQHKTTISVRGRSICKPCNEAVQTLEDHGCVREKKEDREGRTRSGWWCDDCYLGPLSDPQLAVQMLLG
jgi:hypothetical protein